MLVISRGKNESLVLNDDIIVTVIEVRGDKVRLGIECPKDVTVMRREVYEAVNQWREPRRTLPVLPLESPPIAAPDRPATLTISSRHRTALERFASLIGRLTGSTPSLERAAEIVIEAAASAGPSFDDCLNEVVVSGGTPSADGLGSRNQDL